MKPSEKIEERYLELVEKSKKEWKWDTDLEQAVHMINCRLQATIEYLDQPTL